MFTQNDGWEMVKEANNTKVYTRKTSASDYEQIRIVTKVQAPISEIVNALEDVNYHQEWVYETKETKLLEKRGVGDFEYYALMNMPFPVKDRDIIIGVKRSQDPNSKVVDIKSFALLNKMPEQSKRIRIKTFLSTYKISPLDNGWVEVDYFMAADPGGKLPAWIVNMFTVKGPVATMESMVELIDSDYYKGKKVEGIID
jgi:hypothetical protein